MGSGVALVVGTASEGEAVTGISEGGGDVVAA